MDSVEERFELNHVRSFDTDTFGSREVSEISGSKSKDEPKMTQLRASMGSVDLSMPEDRNLLEAAGRVALAHGQLELMLRMTLKTLTGLSVDEALDATEKSKNWELRKDILDTFRRKPKTRRCDTR